MNTFDTNIKVTLDGQFLTVNAKGYDNDETIIVNLKAVDLITYTAYAENTAVQMLVNGEAARLIVQTPEDAQAIVARWLEVHAR